MYKTSILYYNILFSICCKGKRWDNARLLIKVGEFLAEVIARYLREERDISSFSFGRLPKKKGGKTDLKKLMIYNIYGNTTTK